MRDVRELVEIKLGFNLKEEGTEVKVAITKLFHDMVNDFGCEKEVYQMLEKIAKDLDDMVVFINDSKKEGK